MTSVWRLHGVVHVHVHVYVYVYFQVWGICTAFLRKRGSCDLFSLLFLCIYMHVLYIWDLAVDHIYFNLTRGYTATKLMCIEQSH
jgi:hypothetical protein